METDPIDADKMPKTEPVFPRPKRAHLTAEESLRRTEEFIARGAFIAPQPARTEAEPVLPRPKRAKISEAEAIQWTEEFAAKRKERFIASVRESKG